MARLDRQSRDQGELIISRFPGTQHHEVLRTYLQSKYRDRPIGVVVVQGSSSLEFLMRSRAQLWPGTPVVFDSVDKATADRLNLPPDLTGTIYHPVLNAAVNWARHSRRIVDGRKLG